MRGPTSHAGCGLRKQRPLIPWSYSGRVKRPSGRLGHYRMTVSGKSKSIDRAASRPAPISPSPTTTYDSGGKDEGNIVSGWRNISAFFGGGGPKAPSPALRREYGQNEGRPTPTGPT